MNTDFSSTGNVTTSLTNSCTVLILSLDHELLPDFDYFRNYLFIIFLYIVYTFYTFFIHCFIHWL